MSRRDRMSENKTRAVFFPSLPLKTVAWKTTTHIPSLPAHTADTSSRVPLFCEVSVWRVAVEHL